MNNTWHKYLASLWLIIVISLGAYCFHTLQKEDKVQFDLLALLPQGKTKKIRLANEFMSDSNITRRLIIAFGHDDREQAIKAIKIFRDQVEVAKLPIKELDMNAIELSYKNLFTDMYSYRAGLLGREDRTHLIKGHGNLLVKFAIANIISPFSSFNATQMKTDPFGLFPRYVTSLHATGAMQSDSKGNFLIQRKGKTWAIYQGEVQDKIFSLQLQEKISETLMPILKQIKSDHGVQVLRTGSAFYSAAGAKLAQKEISHIGTLSTVGIIIILAAVLSSIAPIVLAATVVTAGLICGLAVCLVLFGSIHILAFVFGCSLVGVAVDYALHYYCTSFHISDRFRIFKALCPAMPLGVITSSLGYGSLLFAPFPGMQQMAILACVGLLTTFFSVALWGPFFIGNSRKTPVAAEFLQQKLEKIAHFGSKAKIKKGIVALLVLLFCYGAPKLTFDDNVRNYQAIDPILKREEGHIQTMMNFNNSVSFIAINDKSLDAILSTQEAIGDTLTAKGISFKALSDLLPSQKRWRENSALKWQFCQNHFKCLSEAIGNETPFASTAAGFDIENISYNDEFIKKLPTGWKELIHTAEDGTMTGRIIVHSPINASDLKSNLSADYVDPAQEYNKLFSFYRKAMILMAVTLFALFFFILTLREGISAAAKIMTPVSLAIIASICVLGALKISFTMFHAMGLILVLCIGTDYALFLYWKKEREKGLLLLGNALAALTTILSFGLLSLSTTTAVQSFGAIVFMGIFFNFFITTFFLSDTQCKNTSLS